jgi:hypothetical protein
MKSRRRTDLGQGQVAELKSALSVPHKGLVEADSIARAAELDHERSARAGAATAGLAGLAVMVLVRSVRGRRND